MNGLLRNMFVRVLLIVLLVFFLVTFVALRLKENDLIEKEARLEAEIARRNEAIDELQAQIDRPFDEEYVAQIAHEKLGLRYPQEIVFYTGDGN